MCGKSQPAYGVFRTGLDYTLLFVNFVGLLRHSSQLTLARGRMFQYGTWDAHLQNQLTLLVQHCDERCHRLMRPSLVTVK